MQTMNNRASKCCNEKDKCHDFTHTHPTSRFVENTTRTPLGDITNKKTIYDGSDISPIERKKNTSSLYEDSTIYCELIPEIVSEDSHLDPETVNYYVSGDFLYKSEIERDNGTGEKIPVDIFLEKSLFENLSESGVNFVRTEARELEKTQHCDVL